MKKIILIDDNKFNQRELYGASFVDKEEYGDCLFHVEKLNENSDFSFIDDAICVLLHDSLDDYDGGKFNSGSRLARECVLNIVTKQEIPYVIFSDGHSPIGDWDESNPYVVRSIKKSELYRNLKNFLEAYRESDKLDLRIIAYGNDFEKREKIYLLQQINENLNKHNDKDILTESMLDEELCKHFFDKTNLTTSYSFDKILESIHTVRLTIGVFRNYLNTLISRSLKYSVNNPKKNILLLGNELSRTKLAGVENITYKQFSAFELGEKGERELFSNISSSIPCETDAIIIDVDCTLTPDACLIYALAIRLSLIEKQKASLAPIILMSGLTPEILRNSPYSTILQTKAVSFETPAYTPIAINLIEPLASKDYRPYFLDIINIRPNSTEGRHSLANQWGADVLNRIVVGTETNNELIKKARQSLYFKYTRALSLSTNDIENIINNAEPLVDMPHIDSINASGKKILLIDDEADKGWKDVLSELLKGAEVKSIQEQVPDYESLSQEAKSEIESGNYDLIFLDLRMNGVLEENSFNPHEFSGMKILKEIKRQNKGNQVIMFTASNKAWNMKAILDAGADGYYIKESPEYAFPASYSIGNAKELCNSINRCLGNGYLRYVYTRIKHIKQLIEGANCFEDRTEEIIGSIDIAYDLLAKSDTKPEYKAYSYLRLFLIIEEYVNNSNVFDGSDDSFYLYNGREKRYRLLKDKKDTEYNSVITMKQGAGHYILERGKYKGRYIDTNFRVAAMLIFKFGQINSSAWTKINSKRLSCAHPKKADIVLTDFDRILDFMLVFFDDSKAKWRDIEDAFPDATYEDRLASLQEKFNKK